MCIHQFGPAALAELNNVSEEMRCNASDRLRLTDVGEIERVKWLRATGQPRRVDKSLLTENWRLNWDIRVQGEERTRQAHLLRKIGRRSAKRQPAASVPRGRTSAGN
jgi:hypothetical protein